MPHIFEFSFFLIAHKDYHILNMLKIKCDINQQDLKRVDLYFVKSEYFHLLEVVDRVSETQLQVDENFRLNSLAVKGLIE